MEASRDARLNLLFDFGAHGAFGDVEIVTGLKIDPELRRRPEIAPQAESSVGRDAAASEHEIVQPRARNLDCLDGAVAGDVGYSVTLNVTLPFYDQEVRF